MICNKCKKHSIRKMNTIQKENLYTGGVIFYLYLLDEIECHIIKFDDDKKRVRIQPNLKQIFDKL